MDNLQIELASVAIALHKKEFLFKLIATSDDIFITDLGKKILNIIKDLSQKRVLTDIVILKSKLDQKEYDKLLNAYENVDPEKGEEYLKILKEFLQHRSLEKLASELKNKNLPLKDKLKNLSDTTLFITSSYSESKLYHISEIVDDLSFEPNKNGIKTNIGLLDDAIGGFFPGDYIVVAGRPGMGKTAFAIDLMVNICYFQKKPWLYFTVESTAKEIGQRYLGNIANVSYKKFRVPQGFSNAEKERIKKVIKKVSASPFILGAFPSLTPLVIDNFIRQQKMVYPNLGGVTIDYIQNLSGGEETDTVAKHSRELRELTIEHNIPFLILSQLKRPAEKKDLTKRPDLNDLKQSGAIEQDAVIVMFLHRKSYFNNDLLKEDLNSGGNTDVEIILRKNRFGETGTVETKYNLFSQHFGLR